MKQAETTQELLSAWGHCLQMNAEEYVQARNRLLGQGRTDENSPESTLTEDSLRAALAELRVRFDRTVTDAERDFRLIFSHEPGLTASFFDLMPDIRTTPENAAESLRDFFRRSLPAE